MTQCSKLLMFKKILLNVLDGGFFMCELFVVFGFVFGSFGDRVLG